MHMTPQKALRLAIEVAKESNLKRYRLGAVLYDRNHCVSGFNYIYGVEVPSKKNRWSVHAEEHSIIKGSRVNIDFKKSVLVVARINKNNEILLAKPCIHCQNLIRQVGVPEIYYTSDPE